MEVAKKSFSSDRSQKYLLKLADGEQIEAVFIPQHDGVNLCISCQVGCVNRCRHCATATLPYIRDLTSEEIVEQVRILLEDVLFTKGSVKVLFMGMGEPLLNYENVCNAVTILTQELNLHSVDNITVSTSGVVTGIHRLATELVRPRLAVTIAAASDERRSWLLIPMGKLYSLSTVLSTCREYNKATGDSVIFQFPLIKDFNDSMDEARVVASLLKDIPSEVHVIPFNEFKGSNLEHPKPEAISAFLQTLSSCGIRAIAKPSFGVDVMAGCGQLVAAS